MMRLFNSLVGFIFCVLGIVLVCHALWEKDFISSSRLLWQFHIGLALATIGSAGIITGFRGDLDLRTDIRLKRQPVKTFLVIGFVIVQNCILAFQVHELLRYSAEIEPFMPSMAREGDAGVIAFFHFGTIVIPAACQFILLPVIWLGILDIAKNSWRGGLIAVVSVCIASFSWFSSFVGFSYTIATFD